MLIYHSGTPGGTVKHRAGPEHRFARTNVMFTYLEYCRKGVPDARLWAILQQRRLSRVKR